MGVRCSFFKFQAWIREAKKVTSDSDPILADAIRRLWIFRMNFRLNTKSEKWFSDEIELSWFWRFILNRSLITIFDTSAWHVHVLYHSSPLLERNYQVYLILKMCVRWRNVWDYLIFSMNEFALNRELNHWEAHICYLHHFGRFSFVCWCKPLPFVDIRFHRIIWFVFSCHLRHSYINHQILLLEIKSLQKT